MKKLLLFLISLLQLSNLIAQSNVYKPFPTKNAVWLKEKAFTGSGTVFYPKYEIMYGDTIIESKTYQKLVETTSGKPYYLGGLRQDVSLKKVYYRPAGEKEQLLYNFDLAVGDTVNGAEPKDTITVKKIDSVLVGNVYHKAFRLKSSQNFDAGSLIEGVGHSGGMLEHYVYTFEHGRTLLCFSVKIGRAHV